MLLKLIPYIFFTKSLLKAQQYSQTVFMDSKRIYLLNIYALACSKAEIQSLCLKI